MKQGLLSIFLILFSLSVDAASYDEAVSAYESKEYLSAINLLEIVTQEHPTESRYFHLLGRAYGRQAELSPWYEAIKLAKHTRENLEIAVELDPKNIDALVDLRNFYKKAPPFLGGGKQKADTIAKRLEALGVTPEEDA